MKTLQYKIFLGFVCVIAPVVFLFAGPQLASAECTIQSATFSPSGRMADGWFKDDAPPSVRLTVKGSPDCAGKEVEVSVSENDFLSGEDAVSGIDDIDVTFPASNIFTIDMKAGEDECDSENSPDCQYFIDIAGDADFSTEDQSGPGNLEFNCDGEGDLIYTCDTNWTVVTNTPAPEAPLGTCKLKANLTGQIVELKNETEAHCHALADDPANASGFEGWIPNGTSAANTSYKLLSPLPGLEDTYEIASDNPLSHYLNTAITIFIGICAVLAVIMIVIGGLEYMTSELVSSKESGKSKITRAIFGLILALGAWTILSQINPDLLNADLKNLTTQTVTVDLVEEIETPAMAQTSSDNFTGTTSATEGCPENVVIFTTQGGNFTLCRKISAKVKAMIDKAWTEGIELSGGGYRSTSRQESLRAQNCGGQANIYKQNAKCNPLTAYPGKSRHENGLAVDLTCEGQLIRAQDNKCFVWLKNNAAAFDLRNLPQEPWHWSVDGR